MIRSLLAKSVYGFLRWFESFDSVWQTTLLCVAVGFVEIAFPAFDRHLIAVLIVSLYATFTQNGLAHENKLTSDKIDTALTALLQLARDEVAERKREIAVEKSLIAQNEAIAEMLAEVREDLTRRRPRGGTRA